MTMSISC